MDHLSETLEREYRLRAFNKSRLGMGETSGSPTQQVIGMASFVEANTGKTQYVTMREPSYFRDLLDVFKHYPVFEHFGLTPETAMALPLDRWYKISQEVKTLPDKPDKMEETMIEIMRELVRQRNQNSE